MLGIEFSGNSYIRLIGVITCSRKVLNRQKSGSACFLAVTGGLVSVGLCVCYKCEKQRFVGTQG